MGQQILMWKVHSNSSYQENSSYTHTNIRICIRITCSLYSSLFLIFQTILILKSSTVHLKMNLPLRMTNINNINITRLCSREKN